MKTKNNTVAKPKPSRPNGELVQAEIAFAAYCIWEKEGRPNGREVDHWLRAEALLRQAHVQAHAERTRRNPGIVVIADQSRSGQTIV